MKHLLLALVVAASASTSAAQSVTATLFEYKVQLSRDTVKAGRVTFQITNTGTTSHILRVEGPDVAKESIQIARRQAGTLTVTLKPGTYEVSCPASGGSHKMAGMVDTLVVIGAPPPPPAAKKPPR